ncbi:universal stress protein domain containing protein [Musa troglodytarum]|uniref:Universal stress protein domain containing protein n=1 Tax=Musa troglodytarum TaxID=320322 RepID=A0A9E7FHH8_9LILI|nr:universal stress protein domain containing protein [Musa troglodytarum]
MGRSGIRLLCCCRSRAAAPIRLGSPQPKPKPKLKFVADRWASVPEAAGGDEAKKAAVTGRKIVVAVDSGPEARAALQWALSHSLHGNDSLVLVSVVKPPRRRDRSQTEWSSRSHQALLAMQSMCQARRPEIKVELSVVEGRERGPAIVEEAGKQGASLLVLGQKKRSIAWRVVRLWSGNSMRGGGVVDYCIQNASCMTLAVRRKSRRGGGYSITTKHHKNFWLLA